MKRYSGVLMYDPDGPVFDDDSVHLEECDDGGWVKWDDHAKE